MTGTPGTDQDAPTNRFDRRKARTRRALIEAAQVLLASGQTNASVTDVTEAADVGVGTFYNHFTSKDELFAAAIDDALEQLADSLDAHGEEVTDPAEVFARSFRLLGRHHRLHPELSRVLLTQGFTLAGATSSFWARARRDIERAVAAGRLTVADVDLAMVTVTGATICLGLLLLDDPDRDEARAVDGVAADLLVVLGLSRRDAAKVCARPLPAP